jgi:hypothetical protein
MQLFRQTRLSVTKISKEEWNFILDLAGHPDYKVEIEQPDQSLVDSTTLSVDLVKDNEIQSIEERALENDLDIEATAEFLNEVVEDVADKVAEQVAVDFGQLDPVSEGAREEFAELIAENITDQLADVIEEEVATGGAIDDLIQTTEIVADTHFGKLHLF